MKIIDFHLHLNPTPNIHQELTIARNKNLPNLLAKLSKRLQSAKIESGMAIILDTGFLGNPQAVRKVKEWLRSSPKTQNLYFSAMLDFRDKKAFQHLKTLIALGFKGVKFHPTIQKITSRDYYKVKQLALKIDSYNKLIIIDSRCIALNTEIYSSLNFAKYLLPQIKCPVILAHSGGLKALEANMLALEYNNVYLETSISVPFWQGSSIEQDLAFSFKKIGSHRCIYGSDNPNIDIKESLRLTNNFLIKHKFTKRDIENIKFNTANSLLNK